MIRLVKPTTKFDSLYLRNDWFEFYPKWDNLSMQYSPWSYFDQRAMITFSGVPFLILILSPVIIYFHLWILFIGLVVPFGKLYLNLPIYSGKDQCEHPSYGFYLYAWDSRGAKFNTLVICKGNKTKHIDMPWALEWVRTSALKKNGTWEHETKRNKNREFYDVKKWEGILWSETYPYTYVRRSGEVQKRMATLRVEEREWRPKWFMWTSLFSKIRKTIEVNFSDEVGERTGSWKGGCIGCGYDMKHGELPEQTLRRMEKERKFT